MLCFFDSKNADVHVCISLNLFNAFTPKSIKYFKGLDVFLFGAILIIQILKLVIIYKITCSPSLIIIMTFLLIKGGLIHVHLSC